MNRLGRLITLPAGAERQVFDPAALKVGIAHIDLDAFHRPNQAVPTAKAIETGSAEPFFDIARPFPPQMRGNSPWRTRVDARLSHLNNA